MGNPILIHESHFYFMSDFVYDILPSPGYLMDKSIALPDLIACLIELTVLTDEGRVRCEPTKLADLIYQEDYHYQDAYVDAIEIVRRSNARGLFRLYGDKLTQFIRHCTRLRNYDVRCNFKGEYYTLRLLNRA